MSVLTVELLDLLVNFFKNYEKTKDNKLILPKNLKFLYKDINSEIAVDAVRYLIFNGGIYQEHGLLNKLPVNAEKRYCLEAYDHALKMINFILFPLPFPLSSYQNCCTISNVLIEVAEEMSVNLPLLNEIFTPILKYDKFVRDLLSISNEVYGPGGRKIEEDIRTHICRSDFFIHLENMSDNKSDETEFCRFCHYDYCLCDYGRNSKKGKPTPLNPNSGNRNLPVKLVEINLGACSLSHYSSKVYKVHDKILTSNLVDLYEKNDEMTTKVMLEKEKLHVFNDPNSSFTYPIYESHNLYLNRYPPIFGKKRLCVLLITDINVYNYFDAYFISNNLFEDNGIHVKTVQLDMLINWMKNKNLFLANEWEYNPDGSVNFTKYTHHGVKLSPGRLVLNLGTHPSDFKNFKQKECFEVSVIYSRDYYDSSEMVSDDSVHLRKLIEFGDAVKIPNTLIQLVNTKRAQLYFSNPENLDKLVESYNKRIEGVKRNKGATEMTKETAILQVDPSLESSQEVVRDAIKNPQNYVLKPNREIGRGLLFGFKLALTLKMGQFRREGLSKYVLMKKIRTPKQPALFVKHLKNGSFELKGDNSLTELGIYHYALYDRNECKFNETNGYLARTKPEYASGGGIGAGFGFVNSLLFF